MNGVGTGRGICVGRLGRTAGGLAVVALLAHLVGCQGAKPIQSHQLIQHQALVDFSGLKPAEHLPDLKVNAAVPTSWEQLPTQKTFLYTHVQWRSPSAHTGVGAAHVHMPLPLSADAVIWLAKKEYAKNSGDGKSLGQWTDELGRTWFEAENHKYHVRGYALAQGFDAWIVYFGYRLDRPPHPTEISMAARCADTFVPLVGGVKPEAPPPALPLAPLTSLFSKSPKPSTAPATRPSTPPAGE